MEKQPSPGGDEDEKVGTSSCVWRHERAITGADSELLGECVCVMTEMCGQAESDCRRNRAASREAAEARGDTLEELWSERHTAKGPNGQKWKPTAEGIQS